MAVRINQWIRRYQKRIHDAIMNRQIPMDMPPLTIGKHYRSKGHDDDSSPESKRVGKDANAPPPQYTADNQSRQLEGSDSLDQDPCGGANMVSIFSFLVST
jgi:hypothetical protein